MHRSTAAALVGVVIAGTVLGTAAPAAAAAVPDPERYSVEPAGWGWKFSADKATINAWADRNDMRITDVEVLTPSTFTVVMVRNAGVFKRGLSGTQSWTTDLTEGQLVELPGNRPLDIERYTSDGQTRFAAALVDNSGANHHDYKIYLNSTKSYIDGKVASWNGRVTDIDPTTPERFDTILLKNAGVDAMPTWWYPAQTAEQIGKLLETNKARLVDIEPDGKDTFTVVMVAAKGEYWWWHPAATQQQVLDLQAQNGMRIIHLKRYTAGTGDTRYAVIYLDTLDPASVQARQAMWPAAGDAAFGFYLKRVDGAVYNSLQADKTFEPASMLKALHHITAMLAVHDGNMALAAGVSWYRNPNDPDNKDVCAYDDNGAALTSLPVADTLSMVLQGMMQVSDNRKTDAIYDFFGPAAINQTAATLGMTGTTLNHRIGCTWKAPGQVAAANELTLTDEGRLFESVYRANNPVLGTGADRDAFAALMSSGLGSFLPVVDEEAAKLGKSAAVAQAFKDAMRGAYKNGGYVNGAPNAACDDTGCTALLMRSTGGGAVSLPVKQNNTTAYRTFVYGAFFDGVWDCGPGDDKNCGPEWDALGPARGAAYQAMLRAHINAALSTW
ncbi:serine hydrolase [Dactylosporangium siamense]|uniref:Beta-lactamase class A catalytic domain-containing protein n=1 Tax=Dactylosporangium siamense TaxID=685454 RepID=A0A919PLY1_9ACTN|nr:serine hydrolase [Dactylosporangium siamense]GIG47220.1 hypothetical protein Dsi01nite_052610 [Dactylosporangium siamense]